jgi:hypothetical protein
MLNFEPLRKEASMTRRLMNSFLLGTRSRRSSHRALAIVLVLAATLCLLSTAPAAADTLFWEDFNGYTSFPAEHPAGDPINPGLPKPSEGSDEIWYGGRFEVPNDGSIDQDLAVQRWGDGQFGTNNTPVGRMEDDAGLLFNISTLNLLSATLSFDWRTFSVSATDGDKFRAGYYVGELDFGGSSYYDFVAEFGSGWWNTSWVEIVNGRSSSFLHEIAELPVGVESIWVAFWLDDGEGDFGKIDNIHVEGTVVPEPSSVLIAGLGAALCACLAVRRRITARRGSAAR